MKDTCTYCGGVAGSRDHIPPKNLFPKPRTNDLISVPSCVGCNKAFSKDDEYLRFVLTMRADTFEQVGANPDWSEDRVGYCFVIEALPHLKQGRVTVMIDDEPRVAFSGDTRGLYKMLASWTINRDHLAYVAYELGRAEMAVRHDAPYLQE